MFRVSDSQIHRLALTSLAKARARYLDAARRATTGKRVNRLSDDPGAGRMAAMLRRDLRRIDGYAAVRQRVSADLGTIESAVTSVADLLSQAKALAVQMASDTMSASDRAIGKAELDAIIDQIRGALSVKSADGRYLLSGTAPSVPPLSDLGQYQGAASNRYVEVAPGVTVQATFTVPEITGGKLMQDLGALSNALANDDVAGIGQGIENMQAAIDEVAVALSAIGGQLAAVNAAEAQAEAASLDDQVALAEVTGADLAAAVTDLTASEQAMTVAGAVSKKLMDIVGQIIGR